MKDIFTRIEGREWDWFGFEKDIHDFNVFYGKLEVNWKSDTKLVFKYSLADLLANKSFNIACFGEEDYTMYSVNAFVILMDDGEKEAINYIKKHLLERD